jgi:hypothetical protein
LGKRSPTGEQRANAGDQEEAQFLEHGYLARGRIYHICRVAHRNLRQAMSGVSFRAYGLNFVGGGW